MRRLLSFGGYTFPDTIPERGELIYSNFSNTVPRVVKLPGMDGGFDEYGDDPPARETGAVRYRFVLTADSAAEMMQKHDAVMAMASYGRALLTVEAAPGEQRFTWAKVNNISAPIHSPAYTDRIVRVAVDFQVTLPNWFSDSPDSPQVEACSGTATDFTVTNAGNSIATPVITVDPSAGGLASGLVIQRIVSAQVVDEIEYDAALIGSDILVIDTKKLSVRKNDTDAYGSAFAADHPAWMRLLPGDNTIRVILGGGESADVTFTWDDTWI